MNLLATRSLRRFLPLLLAVLVLLAQALALSHRTAHPNTGQRTIAALSVAPGSALDMLFGHASGAACDDFDAALGLDLNPGQYSPDVVALVQGEVEVASQPAALDSVHPAGLSLARAPPRA